MWFGSNPVKLRARALAKFTNGPLLHSVRALLGLTLFIWSLFLSFDGFPGALLSWLGGGIVLIGYTGSIATLTHNDQGMTAIHCYLHWPCVGQPRCRNRRLGRTCLSDDRRFLDDRLQHSRHRVGDSWGTLQYRQDLHFDSWSWQQDAIVSAANTRERRHGRVNSCPLSWSRFQWRCQVEPVRRNASREWKQGDTSETRSVAPAFGGGFSLGCGPRWRIWLSVEFDHSISMSAGFPEVTEQDPSLPEQLGDRKERLAKFVMELWAQHRQVVETRRRIDKRFADQQDWLVRKDTELVD